MGFIHRLLGGESECGKDLSETICGITHTGKVRKGNEDYFLIHVQKKLFIVSDGMGGHNAGEVASLNAVQTLNRSLSAKRISEIAGDVDRIRDAMVTSLVEANRTVRGLAKGDRGLRGMGCTLVAALIDGNRLHLCHVGDSRAYLSNRSGIRLLTTDHSYVMSLVAEGRLTIEEARESPIKNELTQAVGAMSTIEPDFGTHRLKNRDRLLLCSDGLWDMLSDKVIHGVLREACTAKGACETLVRKANAAGGKDNITAVVVEHRK